MTLSLLSHLWLHEPDADTVARAVAELGLPSAHQAELGPAYTEAFLLNVYPYATAFTDPDGELNGPEAQNVAARFAEHGYHPPELNSVGAPDHLGLCLGFLAYVSDTQCLQDTGCLLLEWAPVCCLAVEREPSAHAFYRALARVTRETLLSRFALCSTHQTYHPLPITDYVEAEVSLRDIVRFFLAPARCGVFLSRSQLGQLAKGLGRRLPFGSRFEVTELLFASAGEAEAVEPLITALESECDVWGREYWAWARQYPAWQPTAETWLGRTANAARILSGMRQVIETERI